MLFPEWAPYQLLLTGICSFIPICMPKLRKKTNCLEAWPCPIRKIVICFQDLLQIRVRKSTCFWFSGTFPDAAACSTKTVEVI